MQLFCNRTHDVYKTVQKLQVFKSLAIVTLKYDELIICSKRNCNNIIVHCIIRICDLNQQESTLNIKYG